MSNVTAIDPERAVSEQWFIRPKEAARRTGLSPSEIYRGIYSGQLKATQFKTRVWLIRPADLEEWVRAHSQSNVA